MKGRGACWRVRIGYGEEEGGHRQLVGLVIAVDKNLISRR